MRSHNGSEVDPAKLDVNNKASLAPLVEELKTDQHFQEASGRKPLGRGNVALQSRLLCDCQEQTQVKKSADAAIKIFQHSYKAGHRTAVYGSL